LIANEGSGDYILYLNLVKDVLYTFPGIKEYTSSQLQTNINMRQLFPGICVSIINFTRGSR